MMKKHLSIFAVLTLVLIGVAGCQPQAAPTRVPPTLTAVVLATSAPTVTTEAGYPLPAQTDAAPSEAAPTAAVPNGTSDQPGYPPASDGEATPGYAAPEDNGLSAGMPAVDNRSKVTAKLIDSAADPDSAGYTRLHVLVLASEDVEKMQNFTRKLINTEADLYVETAKLPALKAGDQFVATVAYNGDENGGKYMVVEIEKK
jgi:hypothetical protein